MPPKDCPEEFKVECNLRRLSPRTIRSYYNSTVLFLNYLDKHLQIRDLELIRPPHIKKYIQYLLEKKLSPRYINGILKCLRAFFKYAYGEGYISVNPAHKVNWQREGKGNRERHVPLTPYLRKLLFKYLRIKQLYFDDKAIPYRNLLLSRTGNPLTKEALEHVFKQAADKAAIRSEIRCSPHTARHYYAQANLRNGLDVYSLSRLLGHENINITKRYLQSLQDSSIVELAVNTSPLRNIRI